MKPDTQGADSDNSAKESTALNTPDAGHGNGDTGVAVEAPAIGALQGADLLLTIEDLCSDEEKRKVIHDLALRIMPEGIDPSIWGHWLGGGPPPFAPNALVSPTPAGVPMSRARFRQSKVVMSAVSDLEKAEKKHRQAVADIEKSTKELAAAKEELALAKAKDAAMIEYLVTKNIAEVLSPIFAMGPAWVLMRAVSSYLDRAAIERDLVHVTEARRPDFELRLIESRRKSSELILRVLSSWSADPEFESELHDAIFDVAQKYAGRDSKFGKRRSVSSMRKSVPSDAKIGAAEVLAGMSPAKP